MPRAFLHRVSFTHAPGPCVRVWAVAAMSIVRRGRLGFEGEPKRCYSNHSSEARLQETFRLGNIGPNLCKKFDRLHFGIFRAGEQPPGKKRAERMVNRLGIMGFLSVKLLPDRGIEHLYACGLVHFLGRSTVGWSDRNVSRIPAVCGLGDRRPSSQLRRLAKVTWK